MLVKNYSVNRFLAICVMRLSISAAAADIIFTSCTCSTVRILIVLAMTTLCDNDDDDSDMMMMGRSLLNRVVVVNNSHSAFATYSSKYVRSSLNEAIFDF